MRFLLGPQCPLCSGSGVIHMTLCHPVVPLDLDKEPVAYTSDKRYPCPECQQVFYRADLIQVYSSREFIPEIVEKDERYSTHLTETMARALGSQAHKHGGLIRVRDRKPEPMTYWREMGARRADMFIVKQDAQGWHRSEDDGQATDAEHRDEPQGPGRS